MIKVSIEFIVLETDFFISPFHLAAGAALRARNWSTTIPLPRRQRLLLNMLLEERVLQGPVPILLFSLEGAALILQHLLRHHDARGLAASPLERQHVSCILLLVVVEADVGHGRLACRCLMILILLFSGFALLVTH